MKHYKTLNTSLLILFLTSILIPLLMLTAFLTTYWQHNYLKIQESQYNTLLYSVTRNIETYTDDIKRLSLSPHTYRDLMSFYSYVQTEDYNNPDNPYNQLILTRNYSGTIQNLLTTSREDTLGICFAPIRQDHSNFYICSKFSELTVLKDYDYWNKKWYQQALNNNGRVIFTASEKVDYYSKNSIETFSVVRRVRDVYTKKDIGVIKVDLTQNVLKNIFNDIDSSTESILALINEDGSIICSNDLLSKDLAKKAMTVNKIITDKDTYIIKRQGIKDTSWQLIYFSSQKDILKQGYANFGLAFGMSILAFTIAFIVFKRRSIQITSSVQGILDTMEQVGHGNLDIQINSESLTSYELTTLSDHFNKMICSLNLHIKNEYQAQLSRKVAEYRALQNQINPHFLYNTLNIFVTLNRLGYKKELETAIIELSNIFRYTCNNVEYCTITQEFDFVSQYLRLQKFRYEERLVFEVLCEEEVKEVIMPKLIVQPLVENAIKHGLEPTDKPITIKVRAQKCTLNLEPPINYAVIIVSNDGLSFNPNLKRTKESIGLTNITERLNLFHKDSFFHIRSGENRLTVEYILIPLVTSKL